MKENLGRVRGGGFYGSTSDSETEIEKTTVKCFSGTCPLKGDTIINAHGALLAVKDVAETYYSTERYGSIKGDAGEPSAFAFFCEEAAKADGYVVGGKISKEIKDIKERLQKGGF